jgi:protein-tyrosine-phosphatase
MPLVVALCTGNAARSVMAGALLAGDPDIVVETRGTHVVEGLPMSLRTRTALSALGVDGHVHRSQQLTDADVEAADVVLAMAREHVQYVRRIHPEAAARTATLKRLARDLQPGPEPLRERIAALRLDRVALEHWEDVEDPAGGDDDVFHECAGQIRDLLHRLAPALQETERRRGRTPGTPERSRPGEQETERRRPGEREAG